MSRANPAHRYIQEVIGKLDNHDVADRELLARFVTQRDEAAFTSLVRRHGRMVLGVCLRSLRRLEDAEDAFQATFLSLLRTAPSLRPRESIGGWLHTVAYRVAQKTRVASARRRKHEQRVADRPVADEVDRLTVREASEILDEELVRLPNKFRLPLVLCYLEGLSRDEAAERLGWEAGTLKSRLEQARERLATRLAARGLTLPSALTALLFSSDLASAEVTPALVDSTRVVATSFVAGQASSVSAARIISLSERGGTVFATKLTIAAATFIGTAVIGIWAALGSGLSGMDPPGVGKGAPGATTATASPIPKKADEPQAMLDKIDRTIAKEPAYKSKNPKYCLLVFGPEAKTRVWLVHDGNRLYVDRNGNGDLTEEGKRIESTDDFVEVENAAGNSQNRLENQADDTLHVRPKFKGGTITEQDGKTKHTLYVGYNEEKDKYCIYSVNDGKYLQMTDMGFGLRFSNGPKDAPIVHLNGQFAVHPWITTRAPQQILVRGEEPSDLMVRIGTSGIGKGNEAWLNPFKGIPDDIHPVANIEFPNKEPGGKPIKIQVRLTTRASGNNLFYGPLQVPDAAADGKAKVTVSFADWKDRRVAPATFEVNVETPK